MPEQGRARLARWLGAGGILAFAIPMNAFRWLNFALSKDLDGYAFSISGFSSKHPQTIALSFGIVALCLLVAAAAACALNRPRVQCSLGAALLVVLMWGYLKVSLGDGSLMFQLLRQSDWWLLIVGVPPPFSVIEPGVWRHLFFDTISERLFTGAYYLGLGWYFGVFAAAAVVAGSALKLAARSTLTILATAGVAVLTLGVVFLSGPLQAQKDFAAAVRAQTDGRSLTAISLYRQAMDRDEWYAINPRIYERIGQAYASLGVAGTPEQAIYQAEVIVAKSQGKASLAQLPEAIKLYESIAARGGQLGQLASTRADDIRLLYGNHLFQAGAFGPAVLEYESVLSDEPDNWLAGFYAGQGYWALGRYQNSAQLSSFLLVRCGDPLVFGILANNLGDAHMRLGDLAAAHRDYYASYNHAYMRNRFAVSALVGP